MKKTVAVGIAGVAALVVAAWRQIQRDNTLATDQTPPQSAKPTTPKPKPSAETPAETGQGQSLFSPSVNEKSTKAELYEVATELKIEGRSKMNKSELLTAIRAAG